MKLHAVLLSTGYMIAKKKKQLKFESVKSQIFKLLKYNTGIVNIGLEVQATMSYIS